MASMPPNTPPGNPPGRPPGPPYGPPQGTPYGSYGNNPKDYWRYQKEQNKAAWRAQRDMWRAQRDALRAQYRSNRAPSIAGPVVLILVGIIALLLITGRIQGDLFWDWFGHWWPILLIVLGVVALAEWAIDLRRENPPARRFGGYVWLVVLIIALGAGASSHRYWGNWGDQFHDDNGDNFNPFREPQHELDQPLINTTIPANAQIEIQNPRGDVSIAASDDATMDVKTHQIAYAAKDEDAQKIFNSEKAHVTVSGNAVLIKVDSNSNGKTNLTITVPKSASVNVNTGRGNATVAGIGGNVDAQLQHGNFEAASIAGHVHIHVTNQGDVSAHDIQGDVTVDGNGGDLTLSDIHGTVTLQGDYTGDTHLERADQSVHFHSSRTDLEFARLPGDMSLNSDSLHATQVIGPVRVICSRSKDVEMSQVFGDTHIEDKDARVELEMGGSYPVDVKNVKGDIEVSVPEGAGYTVDARTHNGDIVSDFPLEISGDENKTIVGTIGKGGPRMTLSTEHADLRIRKGGEVPAPPAPPSAPKLGAAPKAPTAPGVPHLKAAPKAPPAEPVSQ
jgi:DUF4097 and DUF4098 domain-containing protein YvlB